ncbi:MAG: methylated-DNA--[protein]-cysteine S-methyltransferase [Rhodospirillales bacterium]
MNSPYGQITLFEDDGALVAIEWGGGPEPSTSPLLGDAKMQLDAYFDGRLKSFDLPLKPPGTPFQKDVWKRMIDIPYGFTATYGEIARDMDSAPRAVGGACARNPIPIVIPCHRVVGANGKMVGYSGGGGVETKRALLRLEGLEGMS